jgi:hypothetical protein
VGAATNWIPASKAFVEGLIARQLADCPADLAQWFERIRIEPYAAPILRHSTPEQVFVVARAGEFALYYEDVEEGFNFSALDPAGSIAQPRWEQWELGHALRQLRDHQRRVGGGAAP